MLCRPNFLTCFSPMIFSCFATRWLWLLNQADSKKVLWQQISHLLLKYTKSGYRTVLKRLVPIRAIVPRSEWVSEWRLNKELSLYTSLTILYLHPHCGLTTWKENVFHNKNIFRHIHCTYGAIYIHPTKNMLHSKAIRSIYYLVTAEVKYMDMWR
jgi:hypothetical protein